MSTFTARQVADIVAKCYEFHEYLWGLNESGQVSHGCSLDFADTVNLTAHVRGDITDSQLADNYYRYMES